TAWRRTTAIYRRRSSSRAPPSSWSPRSPSWCGNTAGRSEADLEPLAEGVGQPLEQANQQRAAAEVLARQFLAGLHVGLQHRDRVVRGALVDHVHDHLEVVGERTVVEVVAADRHEHAVDGQSLRVDDGPALPDV